MKHLLTISALLFSSLAMGQNDPFWNPDANGDDLIGFTDLASLLSVYNSSLALSDTVSCDYDGGTFGEFWHNLFSEAIVVDSIIVQWEFEGTETVYVPFCPEPSEENFSFSLERTLFNTESFYEENIYGPQTLYSHKYFGSGDFEFRVYVYSFGFPSYELYTEWSYGAVSGYTAVNYPYLETGSNFSAGHWVYDDQGIYDTSYNAYENQFFRLIPYWHYAE